MLNSRAVITRIRTILRGPSISSASLTNPIVNQQSCRVAFVALPYRSFARTARDRPPTARTPLSSQLVMNNPYAALRPGDTEGDVNQLIHSIDRFNGVTVPDTSLLCIEDVNEFTRLLNHSMNAWLEKKRRGLWIQVPISRSSFIAPCVEQGFEFHHAQSDYVMMTCWLPNRAHTLAKLELEKKVAHELAVEHHSPRAQTATKATETSQPVPAASSLVAQASSTSAPSAASSSPKLSTATLHAALRTPPTTPPSQPTSVTLGSAPLSPFEQSMIPDYASHSLGIGCIVLNNKGECLVIKEKFAHPTLPDFWKLPGGAVDRGEELADAAEREVREETGIESTFRSIIGFRHLLNFRFGCGDLYFISVHTLADESKCEPVPQPEEISACKWWDLQEFLHFHSSRWMQDVIREPVLQEWKKLFPNHTLPPPPTQERIKELQTMPPHPKSAEGKDWPPYRISQPPPVGSSVALARTYVESSLGKLKSSFYVVAPADNSNASSSASATSAPASPSKL